MAAEELKIGSSVELEILLGESESEFLNLTGSIVRLNRQEGRFFEYGIAFSHMGKEARRLFADFCFGKMYEMIGLSDWPTDKRNKD